MKTIMFMFLSANACFLSGCFSRMAWKNKKPYVEDQRIIQINNFTVGKKILSLDYKVNNPFPYDIWICEDTDIYNRRKAETKIGAEKLTIRLRLDCNLDLMGEANIAKYRRLPPGQSYSEILDLELPIREYWAVGGLIDFVSASKPVLRHKTLFEIGYFEGDLLKVLSDTIKKGMDDPDFSPHLEGLQNKHSQNTAYLLHLWKGLRKQKSATVLIEDVEVPCSVDLDRLGLKRDGEDTESEDTEDQGQSL